MATVWVLMVIPGYEEDDPVGVYSSRELAEAAALDPLVTGSPFHGHSGIVEIEIDASPRYSDRYNR